ncbi:MAG: hypothetical protein KGL91_07775 [Xanthomonadaceae bacterium]|nr:hypothetical protein [Xanthomonadaceae bacterium]
MSEGGNGQEWLLARQLCAYTVLDGSAVPARKRKGFVDMALARWSPFADTQSHVEWVGDRAMAWAWSRGRVLAGPDAMALSPPRRIFPESMFRGTPLASGEQLVQLDEGLEGRVWRDHLLVASRWWDEPPALPDWNEFRRGAGLAPASVVPEVLAASLQAQPWAASGSPDLREAFGHYRSMLAAVAVGVACTVLVALLVGVLALKISIWQVDRQIAEQEQALDKIITARDDALQARAAIDARLALRPPAGQVELLGLVSGLMRGQWQLLEWKLPDARTLEVTARMTNPDPRAIVAAWEASQRFTDVTAELGKQPNSVVIKAHVKHATAKGPRA